MSFKTRKFEFVLSLLVAATCAYGGWQFYRQTQSAVSAKPAVADNATAAFAKEAARYQTYVVVTGNSLSRIARKFGMGSWKELHKLNPQIADPNLIFPGQVLLVKVKAATPSRPSDTVKVEEVKGKPELTKLVGVCAICHWFEAEIIGKTVVEKSAEYQTGFKAIEASKRLARSQLTRKAALAGEVRRTDGVFLYRWEMGKPFGKHRDPVKAIKLAPADDKLKEQLLAAFGKKSEPFEVKPGQKIALLLFGDYEWVKDAQWVGDHPIKAEAWPPFVYGDNLVTLVRGLGCYNLMILIEPPAKEEVTPPPPKIEVPSPPVAEAPPPAPTEPPAPPPTLPVPPVFPEPEEKPTLPQPPVFPDVPPPSVGYLPPPPLFQDIQKPEDTDLTIGAFGEHYGDGNNVYGNFMVATLYPVIRMQGTDSHSFGAAGETNFAKGETGDGFDYKFFRRAVDAAYRWRFSSGPRTQDELIARLGVGWIRDEGSIDLPGGKFESEQITDIRTAFLSYEHNREGQLFPKIRISASGDWDVGHEKTASFNDRSGRHAVASPAADKSLFTLGVDAGIYSLDNNYNVVLAGGLKGIYYAENSSKGIRLEAGPDLLNKAVETRLNYTQWQKDDPVSGRKTSTWSAGLGLNINATTLFNRLFKNGSIFAGKGASSSSGDVPGVPRFPD